MRKHHEIHLENERRLVSALEERGVETRLCKRFDYTDASIKWADIVFTAGEGKIGFYFLRNSIKTEVCSKVVIVEICNSVLQLTFIFIRKNRQLILLRNVNLQQFCLCKIIGKQKCVPNNL